LLLSKGHELSLFTRGNRFVPEGVEHLKGDRDVRESLNILDGRKFDVIIDISGRELDQTQKVLELTGFPSHRFLYVSSAGVYANSQTWPLDENSPTDPNSRHIGKVKTENWLALNGVPFTSFRPTYIYGPGNYNPIEKWFFDRIINDKPVPLPSNGSWITQLGHVNDLAEAMCKSLDIDIAMNRIYNCSGEKGITFQGIIETAAKACGRNVDKLKICAFDPIRLDPKARKAFPLRICHFLTDISLAQRELDWSPSFDLLEGFKDSFQNDYILKTSNDIDFSSDQILFDSLNN